MFGGINEDLGAAGGREAATELLAVNGGRG
jgi:hypothetical protein